MPWSRGNWFDPAYNASQLSVLGVSKKALLVQFL